MEKLKSDIIIAWNIHMHMHMLALRNDMDLMTRDKFHVSPDFPQLYPPVLRAVRYRTISISKYCHHRYQSMWTLQLLESLYARL